MVGPGTGLAPFRAYLQERALRKSEGRALGPAMLLFGCRHPDQDFIYRDELEKFAADGICELFVAFSRSGGEKAYVQDLIRRERGKLWKLVEAGAKIFVCGDGSRMEPDVKRELTRLYAEEKDVDALTADAWMEKMTADNRYVLDVWAGG
jgi:cytochrome P450 / NADPH-cytochrome P450 reductase